MSEGFTDCMYAWLTLWYCMYACMVETVVSSLMCQNRKSSDLTVNEQVKSVVIARAAIKPSTAVQSLGVILNPALAFDKHATEVSNLLLWMFTMDLAKLQVVQKYIGSSYNRPKSS